MAKGASRRAADLGVSSSVQLIRPQTLGKSEKETLKVRFGSTTELCLRQQHQKRSGKKPLRGQTSDKSASSVTPTRDSVENLGSRAGLDFPWSMDMAKSAMNNPNLAERNARAAATLLGFKKRLDNSLRHRMGFLGCSV